MQGVEEELAVVDLKGGTAGYLSSVTVEGSETATGEITDVGLAGSQFYGDLVHAGQDPIDTGEAFGLEHRFAAAAVRTAQIAILARELLAFVHTLAVDGFLKLDEHVLHGIPVKVESKDVQMTGLHSAPIGTELPGPAVTPIPDGWQARLPGTEDPQWLIRIPWGDHD